MFAKLIAAGALVAATVPALAADIDVRAEAPRVYVERQEPIYAPGDVVVPQRRIAVVPLAPRLQVEPADSFAYYDGPIVTEERYVTDRVIRTAPLIDQNGPICAPGTLVQMADGRTWLCQ